MKELIVKTSNPEVLDKTLQPLGGLVGQNSNGKYSKNFEGCYTVRAVLRDISFLKFAIQKQGYAEIIREQEIEGF